MEVPEHQMMICEDNNPWPVSRIATPQTADEQLNQMEDVYQEYYQAAEGDVSQKNSGSAADKVLIASAITSVGLMFVIGLIVAAKVLNDDPAPAAVVIRGILERWA